MVEELILLSGGGSLVISRCTRSFLDPFLEAVFEIPGNTTIAEEELPAEGTALTLPQVDTWCEWHYRSGTLQRLTFYMLHE